MRSKRKEERNTKFAAAGVSFVAGVGGVLLTEQIKRGHGEVEGGTDRNKWVFYEALVTGGALALMGFFTGDVIYVAGK